MKTLSGINDNELVVVQQLRFCKTRVCNIITNIVDTLNMILSQLRM